MLKRTPAQDDFCHLMDGKLCGEAWDAISRYVYTALHIVWATVTMVTVIK
ncbi:MAG: hypothetical protein IJ899_02040 [Blautia sp.]|nr:hypothetical protein [Blautia sp.]